MTTRTAGHYAPSVYSHSRGDVYPGLISSELGAWYDSLPGVIIVKKVVGVGGKAADAAYRHTTGLEFDHLSLAVVQQQINQAQAGSPLSNVMAAASNRNRNRALTGSVDTKQAFYKSAFWIAALARTQGDRKVLPSVAANLFYQGKRASRDRSPGAISAVYQRALAGLQHLPTDENVRRVRAILQQQATAGHTVGAQQREKDTAVISGTISKTGEDIVALPGEGMAALKKRIRKMRRAAKKREKKQKQQALAVGIGGGVLVLVLLSALILKR